MPIESNLISQEAIQYLNDQESQQINQFKDTQKILHRDELLQWCNGFIDRSSSWRKASFEWKWHQFRRDSDAKYDDALARSKKDWQSKAFIPITPSHRENIQAALFRTLVGPRPPMEVKPRTDQPNDQSENIKDLTLREMEKTHYEVEFNKGLDDLTTYGSGFWRILWKEKSEERLRRKPVYAPVDTSNPLELSQALTQGPQVIGYSDVREKVQIYRGVDFKQISIWDIFPDPRALEIKGNTIAIRYRLTYGELVAGVKQGYFLPGTDELLRNVKDPEDSDEDIQTIKSDRLINTGDVTRTEYQVPLKCFELFARLPKKWIIDDLQDNEDPEALIPARIIFHRMTVLAIELSDEYDGEAPLYKADYLVVNGQLYGRGIPELLKDLQLVINEGVNQRLDAVNLALTKKYAAIERALVSSKDFNDELGGVIRFDAKAMTQLGITDVRAAFMELNTGTIDRAAFIDPQEMERYAQERSSANRVTLGTAGQVKDANQTLGGMELLRQSAGEKFAYIGMLIEFSALQEIYRGFWKAIYAHIQPQDFLGALGPERARTFQLLSPEEFQQNYMYVPQGVFTAENKALTQARLQSQYALFSDQPWLDRVAFFDQMAKSNNLDPETLRLSPEEMQQMMFAQANLAHAATPLPEPKPSPQAQPK